MNKVKSSINNKHIMQLMKKYGRCTLKKRIKLRIQQKQQQINQHQGYNK